MKAVIHRSADRGHADHGWLNARHSFSFAGYHDPQKVQFGELRVLNDDIIAGGYGFPKHPHDNMEIVTIPLQGSLAHTDSTGHSSVIKAGDIQIMSAGTGIRHSEANADRTQPVNLLQIWVFPKKQNIEPRYAEKKFDEAGRRNQLQTVVAPDGAQDASGPLLINQDAWFSLADLGKDSSLDYELHKRGNGVYVFVIEGTVAASDTQLQRRDAAGFWETTKVGITATDDARLLFIEVPMSDAA